MDLWRVSFLYQSGMVPITDETGFNKKSSEIKLTFISGTWTPRSRRKRADQACVPTFPILHQAILSLSEMVRELGKNLPWRFGSFFIFCEHSWFNILLRSWRILSVSPESWKYSLYLNLINLNHAFLMFTVWTCLT